MKQKTLKKYLFEALGFPIILVDVPMRLMIGEWVLDIDLNLLQKNVLNALIHKPFPLTGAEVRFVRKYFVLTTAEFGKQFGVSHAGVIKWEKQEDDLANMNPATEKCLRLFVLDHLKSKDKEFREFYHEITIEQLANPPATSIKPLTLKLT